MTAAEVKTLRLDRLVLDKDFQFRNGTAPATVNQYSEAMAAGSEFPPISIAMVNGVAVVVDGWHRVEAARKNGLSTIKGIVEVMTRSEARFRATMANLKNGLPLKPKERNAALRAALAIYIQGRRHLKGRAGVKSFEEISRDLGSHVDRGTVRRWIERLHPKTYAKCWAKEVSPGAGGFQELDEVDNSFVTTVGTSLDNALAAFQGIDCHDDRKAMVSKVEAMLELMWDGVRLAPEAHWADGPEDF